jgi:hypothetical protein
MAVYDPKNPTRKKFMIDPASPVSVVIRTIGRPTLRHAIGSAKREGIPAVVVSDGVKIAHNIVKNVQYQCLGRKHKHYGSMAMNVGMLICNTEFGLVLDDDDELSVGAGDIIRDRLSSDPSVDIWISTLQYSNGRIACVQKKGFVVGNVSHPMYRCSIFAEHLMTHRLTRIDIPCQHDYHHLEVCRRAGYKIAWINEITHLIRPKLGGDCGAEK